MVKMDAIARVGATCLLMRTRLISRVITSIYDQELREFGINSPQFALLLVICKIGPASRAEIGRFHRQDRSTLTRNLQIMISEGWIEEVRHQADGRSRPIALTKAGKDLLRDAVPSWRMAQAQAKVVLGEDGAIAITDIADGIMDSPPAA